MSKVIPLTQGRVTIVDDDDYIDLIRHKWRWIPQRRGNISAPGYAIRSTRRPGSRSSINIYMHRQILGLDSRVKADHRDGNGLNNCRSNLRTATTSQNNANRPRPDWAKTPYRGVKPDGHRWLARVSIKNRTTHLGSFGTPEEAAKAYDDFVIRHHGEFARLNFPGDNHVASA